MSLIIIAEVKKNLNILVTQIPQNDVHNVMLYTFRASPLHRSGASISPRVRFFFISGYDDAFTKSNSYLARVQLQL